MADIIKINDTTWRIENGFVRMFLLAGDERALLIDTGATCPEAKQLAESLTDKPVMLINTHGDGDHLSGNGAFAEFMMHPADHANCRVGERFPESRLLPVNDGDILDLGGRILEMIAIPGHTAGSIAILDAAARTLYAGDSVQDGHVFMFGAHRRPAEFAASLEKLAAAKHRFDIIRPAHGTPEIPAGYVDKVAAAWAKVLAGEITPAEEQLHGNTVLTYEAGDCGFYCNKTDTRRTL